ncbi:hypothetical protein OSB04_014205 [Centaurea solstitialis]|uniref:t-SNARE coiled-coil homology domain-containing protein n=1 Tax=Centaurea solstitialis TaxID=347529 RepID=A0AA38WFE2_9ASTR|nr:hypothetical protein OSB04_014205 [Centaurea solstitialis]
MPLMFLGVGSVSNRLKLLVANAVDHVNMGADALTTAKSLQKRSRKCMTIAIILLLVIAIIVILSILKPWKKN